MTSFPLSGPSARTPMARNAPSVDSTSSPSSRPVTRVSPIAGVLGACEGFAQPLAIAPLDRLDECAEIGMVLTQRIKQGVPVRETDVAPHYRIARRDARGVSEATRGIFQNGAMIVVPHHHVHQTVGKHVRQMTAHRQDTVMIGG